METKRIRSTINLNSKIRYCSFIVSNRNELKLHSYIRHVIFSRTIYLMKNIYLSKQENKKEYKYILQRTIYINIIDPLYLKEK